MARDAMHDTTVNEAQLPATGMPLGRVASTGTLTPVAPALRRRAELLALRRLGAARPTTTAIEAVEAGEATTASTRWPWLCDLARDVRLGAVDPRAYQHTLWWLEALLCERGAGTEGSAVTSPGDVRDSDFSLGYRQRYEASRSSYGPGAVAPPPPEIWARLEEVARRSVPLQTRAAERVEGPPPTLLDDAEPEIDVEYSDLYEASRLSLAGVDLAPPPQDVVDRLRHVGNYVVLLDLED
jgi:hypothetical protein